MTNRATHTNRDCRLVEMVEDAADHCQRVIRNGPEPTYANEKLSFAFRRLAGALVLIGWTPTEIRDAAAKAAESEADTWVTR
jgi:hypothetical protein